MNNVFSQAFHRVEITELVVVSCFQFETGALWRDEIFSEYNTLFSGIPVGKPVKSFSNARKTVFTCCQRCTSAESKWRNISKQVRGESETNFVARSQLIMDCAGKIFSEQESKLVRV